ncbi:hypothetical protein PG984_014225 [Apiospora sp. TS-2023a]
MDRTTGGSKQKVYELTLVLQRRGCANLSGGERRPGRKHRPSVLPRLVGPEVLADMTCQTAQSQANAMLTGPGLGASPEAKELLRAWSLPGHWLESHQGQG